MAIKIVVAVIVVYVVGLSASRYAGCDLGFAAIDWLRGVPTTCPGR